MANIDHHIQLTSVIFTPTLTSIGESRALTSEPSLKIQIVPNRNGKDIESISVRYSNPNVTPSRLSEDITDNNIFKSLTYSMKGDGATLVDRAIVYMRSIPKDDVSVIAKEYSKYIEDGLIIDGLVAGIGAYITFLLLNENGAFVNQMPFQFGSPCTVQSGNVVNHNMFSYLSLPLMALSKTATGILLQLVLFIQSFINIWDPLFSPGPTIGPSNEARMCIEVISGYSTHVTASMAKAQSDYSDTIAKTKDIEERLQEHVDESLKKMRREINNLVIEAKASIRELSLSALSQMGIVDNSIKQKVAAVIETELGSQIKRRIDDEITASHEKIREIVAIHTVVESKKFNENELESRLAGIEHRIDTLYEKIKGNIPEKAVEEDVKQTNTTQNTTNQPNVPKWNNFRVPIANRTFNNLPNGRVNPTAHIGSRTWNRRKGNDQ